MKAALYLRVSTIEQVENYSIETQKERLEAFCKSKGWDIFNVYIDGGYSGSTLDRPALKSMLRDLDKIDVVVVYKLDRLSRSQRDTLTLIEKHFLENKVDFVSITETLDTSTPFGKAMLGILSVFAQLERETIAERMRMGHIKRVQNGYHTSGGDHDPAGYKRENGELIIKEDEARHIKLVYNLYEETLSITKVQARLKELGETVWRFRRYRDILSSKLYIGCVSFAGEYYDGRHAPIISAEQFSRVQMLLSRHKGRNSNKAHESLLSGLLTCARCGEIYLTYQCNNTLKDGTIVTYRYYICRSRRFPSEYEEKCTNKTWNYKKLEKVINVELENFISDKQVSKNEIKLINYDTLIKKVDEKISRTLSLFVDGKVDKNLLEEQMEKLDKEKQSIYEKKAHQENQVHSSHSNDQLKQFSFDFLDGDFQTKQSILQKLINEISIDGENVDITWNF